MRFSDSYDAFAAAKFALFFMISLAPSPRPLSFLFPAPSSSSSLSASLSSAWAGMDGVMGVGALTPEENCKYCQRILFYTFTHYRKQTTKRFLRHKIKHLCNRYADYRRHCLMSVQPRIELIWTDMERAVLMGQYKPWGTCQDIKECDKNQSPMEFRELQRAAEEVEASAGDNADNDDDDDEGAGAGGGGGAAVAEVWDEVAAANVNFTSS